MKTLLRICGSCKYYREDVGTCKAFPDGVPLRSDEGHFDVRSDQVGTTVYSMDPNKQDVYEMFRRVHPEVKVPVVITYDYPDPHDISPSEEA